MVAPLVGLNIATQAGGLVSGLMGLRKTGQERELEEELRRQMAGRGSSASERFFRHQLARTAAQTGAASQNESVNPALAARQGAQAGAQAIGQVAGVASERRAQEAEMARQQFGQQIVPVAQRRRGAVGMGIGAFMNTLGEQGAIQMALNAAKSAEQQGAGGQPVAKGQPGAKGQPARQLAGAPAEAKAAGPVPVVEAGSPEALQQISLGVVGQLRAASARGQLSPQLLQSIEQQLTQTGSIDPSVAQFLQEKIAEGSLPPGIMEQIQVLMRQPGATAGFVASPVSGPGVNTPNAGAVVNPHVDQFVNPNLMLPRF